MTKREQKLLKKVEKMLYDRRRYQRQVVYRYGGNPFDLGLCEAEVLIFNLRKKLEAK